MPAFHESEYEKDMRRARRRIADPDALVVEERRVRGMWCGLLLGDISLTGETRATTVRFLQRMHRLPSQGVHDKIMTFSEPLEGWIDRYAFEMLWQERGELLRALKPVAQTIEIPPEDEVSEALYSLWVFNELLHRYYSPVEKRMTQLMFPWIDWDGVAPLIAPEGILNGEFIAAFNGGPVTLDAWRERVRSQFETDSQARLEQIWWRRVREGLLISLRIGTRGPRRQRWIAWGWKGLTRAGAQLRD